jgi:hypothetical protein
MTSAVKKYRATTGIAKDGSEAQSQNRPRVEATRSGLGNGGIARRLRAKQARRVALDASLQNNTGQMPPVRNQKEQLPCTRCALPVDTSRRLVHDAADEHMARHAAKTVTGGGRAGVARSSGGATRSLPKRIDRQLDRLFALEGSPLATAERASFEKAFGTDLSAVRIHTGNDADNLVRRLSTRGLTGGNHLVLGRNAGRETLAHELSHVVQGAGGPIRMDDPPVCDTANASPFEFLPPVEVATPDGVGVSVTVRQPSLDEPAGEVGTEQTYNIHYSTLGQDVIALYAVPLSQVFATAEEAELAGAVCRSDESGMIPVGGALALADIVYVFEPGVGTRALDVVEVTPEYLITRVYTKFAVGAGATALLYTEAGPVLIDAGVAHRGGSPIPDLATRLMSEVRLAVPEGVIRELLITHPHADHINMAERFVQEFEIRSIRINAAQFTMERFRIVETQLLAARETYLDSVSRQLEAQLRERRAAWEIERRHSGLAEGTDAEFEEYIEGAVRARRGAVEPIGLEVVVPQAGALEVFRGSLGRFSLPELPPTPERVTRGVAEEIRFPGHEGEFRRLTLGDPQLDAFLQDLLSSETEPGNTDVDRYSNSYLFELPNGRLLVMPDQRVGDFEALRNEFRAELSRLAERSGARGPGEFQVWDATHHMQIGWTTTPNGMRRMLRFLREFTAPESATGSGVRASDAVVVSVDMANVDPATVWLLRSMGMEVFLASGERGVSIIEVVFPNGQRRLGLKGRIYEGRAPEILLARHSQDVAEWLDQEIDRLERQRQVERPRSEERARITRRLESLRRSRSEFIASERAWITAVRQRRTRLGAEVPADVRSVGIGRSTGEGAGQPALPEPGTTYRPGGEATESHQRLVEALMAEHGIPASIAGETSHFTDTALAIMEQQPFEGEVTAESTLDARIHHAKSRVDAAALELQTGGAGRPTSQSSINRYQLALEHYHSLLAEATPMAPPGTRETYQTELEFVERSLLTLRSEGRLTRHPGYTSEQRIIPLGIPGPASLGQRAGHAIASGAGRAFGAAMLYHTITATDELWQDWDQDTLAPLRDLVGTVRTAQGLRLGLRMVQGQSVGRRGFWFLMALEVAEVALRDYDTERERWQATMHAGAHAAMTAALMEFGSLVVQAGLRIRHPVAGPAIVAVGLGLVFVADPLLDALGVYDLIERWTSFEPSEVTGAFQDLRDMLENFEIAVGARQLRVRKERGTPGPEISEDVAEAARRDIEREIFRIRWQEHGLMNAFREAYRTARTDHAGLVELDRLRDRFLRLHNMAYYGEDEMHEEVRPEPRRPVAGPAQYYMPQDPATLPTAYSVSRYARQQVRAGFESIDEMMSMETMTAGQIQEMDQWEDISDHLEDLSRLLEGAGWVETSGGARYLRNPSGSWEEINQKNNELERMFTNVEYRLEPQRYGSPLRQPMLPPGPARDEYMRLRDSYRRRFVLLQEIMLRAMGSDVAIEIEQPGFRARLDAQASLIRLESAINQHITILQDMGVFIIGGTEGLTNSYQLRLHQHHPMGHGSDLFRLHLVERAMLAVRSDAARAVQDETGDRAHSLRMRLIELGAEADAQIERRRRRGFFFPDETAGELARFRSSENTLLAAILGQGEAAPFSQFEEMALSEGGFTSNQAGEESIPLTTPHDQLERIPTIDLQAEGHIGGIFRLHGPVPGTHWYSGLESDRSDRSQNLIVGEIERSPVFESIGCGHSDLPPCRKIYDRVEVIPLNPAAIRYWFSRWGHTDSMTFHSDGLEHVSMRMLRER